jgi:hypothetical protein
MKRVSSGCGIRPNRPSRCQVGEEVTRRVGEDVTILAPHISTGATLSIKCCVPHLMLESRTSGSVGGEGGVTSSPTRQHLKADTVGRTSITSSMTSKTR